MKSYWVNGILGVWLVILAYLGLPSSAKNVILIISGLVVAFLSFREIIRRKITHNLETEGPKGAPANNAETKKEI